MAKKTHSEFYIILILRSSFFIYSLGLTNGIPYTLFIRTLTSPQNLMRYTLLFMSLARCTVQTAYNTHCVMYCTRTVGKRNYYQWNIFNLSMEALNPTRRRSRLTILIFSKDIIFITSDLFCLYQLIATQWQNTKKKVSILFHALNTLTWCLLTAFNETNT